MRFCSHDCSWARPMPSGDKHPLWKGGTAKRALANAAVRKKMRTATHCERCGAAEHLQGHHVFPVATYPHLAGSVLCIEVLCANCHANVHPEYRSILSRPRIRSGKLVSCIVCGKSRYVTDFIVKRARAEFCSPECWYKSNRSGKEVICITCNKSFYSCPSRLINGGKYCSKTCKYKALTGKPRRTNTINFHFLP